MLPHFINFPSFIYSIGFLIVKFYYYIVVFIDSIFFFCQYSVFEINIKSNKYSVGRTKKN
jgi:hypothetical protein